MVERKSREIVKKEQDRPWLLRFLPFIFRWFWFVFGFKFFDGACCLHFFFLPICEPCYVLHVLS